MAKIYVIFIESIMRSILIILFFMLVALSAKSQKWQQGSFTDVKGNKVLGLIRENPSKNGPIKDEGFIEFKDNGKTNPYKLSAGDLQSFTIGQDSFVGHSQLPIFRGYRAERTGQKTVPAKSRGG